MKKSEEKPFLLNAFGFLPQILFILLIGLGSIIYLGIKLLCKPNQ